MVLKEGVSLQGLHISMRRALIQADNIWKAFGRAEGVTVTSGTDGKHSSGSWHYYGLALDFRTYYFDDPHEVATELRAALPPGFDVVVETDHMHVENDAVGRRLEAVWLE